MLALSARSGQLASQIGPRLQLSAGPLITGKVGVEGVAGAFEALASPEQHAKILVEPWRA